MNEAQKTKAVQIVEDVTELVMSGTQSVSVVLIAISTIRGLLYLIFGETLTGEEYAAAITAGYQRNKTWGEDRIAQLQARIAAGRTF